MIAVQLSSSRTDVSRKFSPPPSFNDSSMLWVSGASLKESTITHTAPQQGLTYVWPWQIWNTSAAVPQLDLVLGLLLFSRFVVSGTRNLELIMLSLWIIMRRKKKSTARPSFILCTQPKQSKNFWNFWRGPIYKCSADAEQALADTAGDGKLSFFSHLQKYSLLQPFSPSATLFFLIFSIFLPDGNMVMIPFPPPPYITHGFISL